MLLKFAGKVHLKVGRSNWQNSPFTTNYQCCSQEKCFNLKYWPSDSYIARTEQASASISYGIEHNHNYDHNYALLCIIEFTVEFSSQGARCAKWMWVHAQTFTICLAAVSHYPAHPPEAFWSHIDIFVIVPIYSILEQWCLCSGLMCTLSTSKWHLLYLMAQHYFLLRHSFKNSYIPLLK